MTTDSFDVPAASEHGLRVPQALDQPASGRSFSAEEMGRRLKVLFIVSRPTNSPAMSVHADLMAFLDRDRVEVHVHYNRLADREPYRSAGTSVLRMLPSAPDVRLRAGEFGPVGGAPKRQLLIAAIRALGPGIRDTARLVRYIRRERIDVIHSEEGLRNGFYAYVLSRMSPAKCLVHFHSQYGDWMSRLSRLAVQRADAIIAVSAWTGRGIHRAGVAADRIFPVLNGIDASAWDAEEVDGGAIREEFEIGADAPLVVMVAQLVAWKRQTTLIEAFRSVVDQHPDARLLIVGGEGAPAAGAVSYPEHLRQLVADAGLERQVTFTGRRPDVRRILAAADIFALPSVGDPCALAHIEAMTSGKPVVCVADGGAPELVEHGRSGLVSPPDDSGQLATNLIALIEAPERRHEMGAYAKRHARTALTVRRMADDVEAVYRHLTGGQTV